jgi:uncharacterized protein YdeI (YjbR/CyaY-like superfamily)
MIQTDNFKQLEISSYSELRQWLEVNYSSKNSICLITYKKSTPSKYVSVSEVLDQLLCFGWIDGIRRKLDNDRTMQLISPRKVQHWTNTYKVRFAKLDKLGLVSQAGYQSVANSQELGLWDYMDDVDRLIKPEDFVTELATLNNATQNWDNFNNSSKRFMLRHIKIAKTPSTRSKRIKEISLLAYNNKKLPGS